MKTSSVAAQSYHVDEHTEPDRWKD